VSTGCYTYRAFCLQGVLLSGHFAYWAFCSWVLVPGILVPGRSPQLSATTRPPTVSPLVACLRVVAGCFKGISWKSLSGRSRIYFQASETVRVRVGTMTVLLIYSELEIERVTR